MNKKTILILPGWGLNKEIFSKFENMLFADSLDNIKTPVVIIGHSLGGFLGYKFALENPGLVERLILISIRKKYKKQEIYLMRKNLIKDKRQTLYNFYKNSFYNRNEFLLFKNKILPNLNLSLNKLLLGLDFLEKEEIKGDLLKKIDNVILVHGKEDKIAPYNEALSLSKEAEKKLFLFENIGHIPFLNKKFCQWINMCLAGESK